MPFFLSIIQRILNLLYDEYVVAAAGLCGYTQIKSKIFLNSISSFLEKKKEAIVSFFGFVCGLGEENWKSFRLFCQNVTAEIVVWGGKLKSDSVPH